MPQESYPGKYLVFTKYIFLCSPGRVPPSLTCLCKGTAINHNQQLLGKDITLIVAIQW